MDNKQKRAEVIERVARNVGTNPAWLDALINFETAGTYNPLVKNPRSSARGLIQVIDATAKDMFNVPDSLALVNMYPDFESQMVNVVQPYLKRYAPFPTKQSLYMAIFYPTYRFVPPETVFPTHVQKVNPGIVRVQDYVDFVDARIDKNTMHFPFFPTAIIIAGIVAVLMMKMYAIG